MLFQNMPKSCVTKQNMYEICTFCEFPACLGEQWEGVLLVDKGGVTGNSRDFALHCTC